MYIFYLSFNFKPKCSSKKISIFFFNFASCWALPSHCATPRKMIRDRAVRSKQNDDKRNAIDYEKIHSFGYNNGFAAAADSQCTAIKPHTYVPATTKEYRTEHRRQVSLEGEGQRRQYQRHHDEHRAVLHLTQQLVARRAGGRGRGGQLEVQEHGAGHL